MKEIEKIYNNFDRLCDNFADLEDTNKGYKELETYIIKETFHGVPGWEKEQRNLMDEITQYAALNEKQGFIYGFQYAVSLLTNPNAARETAEILALKE